MSVEHREVMWTTCARLTWSVCGWRCPPTLRWSCSARSVVPGFCPIWIGASEASAIANAQEGVVPPRPMTHDLMVDALTTLGHRLTEVHITELTGGTFYAVLLFDGVEVSARPSDAIALALRVGSEIYCAEDVLDEAGIEMPEAEEDEVEKFREFLDQVNPDDFVTGEEPKAP